MMRKQALIAVLLAGLAGVCAQAAPGDYEPAYGYGNATLDERVAKLEKKLSGDSQLEMLNRMEQLQNDLLRLRGEVEELSHQLETAKRQQKEMYQDLDRRLQAAPPVPAAPAESAAVAPPPVAPAPAAPAPKLVPASSAPPPAPAAEPPKPAPAPRPQPAAANPAESAARQAAYQKGFGALQQSKYAEAIKEFKSFLAAYPRGEYSDNAAYWLAEAHYVNRDLPAAREAFRRLVKEFPQAPKISDAQLKLGYIDYETGQWASARETLNDVLKRYPDSSAAKLAQKRLDKMKQEGH